MDFSCQEIAPRWRGKSLGVGLCSGIYTAALAEGTPWSITGIDYSSDSDLFLQNMALIGKSANLVKADMFEHRLPRRFDIVCSFGLVEHFRGRSLDEIFELHDSYVNDGGFLVIEMPNFTGFQYFWHYIFDRPDLDNHNVDVMQPASMYWFRERGYVMLHNDYVGPLRLWGNSGWLKYQLVGKLVAALAVVTGSLARVLDRIGVKCFRGRSWSPDFLLVARKRAAPQ